MLRFLRELFGRGSSQTRVSPSQPTAVDARADWQDSHEQSVFSSRAPGGTKYFETMGRMLEAISNRDYATAATLARENLDELPALVRSTKREYGSFDLQGIPGLEQGGTMLALAGDREALTKMMRVVGSLPELSPWKEEPERHLENLDLFAKISSGIAENPGRLQSSFKELVGVADGQQSCANLISWLEKAGRIRRVRQGSSVVELYMAGAPEAPAPPPTQRGTVPSSRSRPLCVSWR